MIPEIYAIYIALIYHGVVWTVVLVVLDHIKNGGSLKNINITFKDFPLWVV